METFKDGQIQLHHGDSAVILNEVLVPESVDLTVTSPPYDNLRTYNGYSAFDFPAIARGLYRVTKQGGVVVWVVGDETKNGCESLTSFKQAIHFVETCGFRLHDTMIYHKDEQAFTRFGHKKYPNVFEYMFALTKGYVKTFNSIHDKRNVNMGSIIRGKVRKKNGKQVLSHSFGRKVKEMGSRTNLWSYLVGKYHTSSDGVSFLHPAIFPEALARDHILSWSNAGDTVLDCFAGSGTTLKMAYETGRRAIGIEISAEYLPIIRKRIDGAKTPLFTLG